MKVSILGHGVVGKGVYEMLCACPQYTVSSVLVRPGKADPSKPWMVDSIEKVLSDDSTLVIECMGGIDPAFEYTSKCMKAGKSIVTANKALVASHGIDLMNLAREKNLGFLFSAACGGAIPILQNLFLARQTDQILWAGGILNGTTNYMLDAMDRRGLSFEDALSEAKYLGYAEADPTADITGLDTLRKIMLISMVAFDTIPNSDYNIEGIENVKALDFEVAKELGCTIRLVGKTGLAENGRLYAYVEPIVCDRTEPYSGICINTNLAQYQGRNCGHMTLSGQGAGRYPTASAVLRDVTCIANGQRQMLGEKCLVGFAFNGSKECEKQFFVRLESSLVQTLGSKVALRETLCQKGAYSFVATEKVSVKEMHEIAQDMRRRGSSLFFAEYDKGNT